VRAGFSAAEKPPRRARRRLAALLSAVVSLAVGCDGGSPPGRPAPELQLVDLSGARRSLDELDGRALLLSFLDLRTPGDPRADDPSKSQAVFLRSMARQYGPQGLRVVVIGSFHEGRSEDSDRLINLVHDWELGDMVLFPDEDSRARSAYGVQRQPTTFLIDSHRFVRWQREGFAPAQELAAAIESVLSGRIPTDRPGQRSPLS